MLNPGQKLGQVARGSEFMWSRGHGEGMSGGPLRCCEPGMSGNLNLDMEADMM